VLSKNVKNIMPASPFAAFAPGISGASGAGESRTTPGMRLYTNPVNSVERSLVMALDNAIKDGTGKPFSKIFMDLKGYSPIGSSEMGRVLAEVRAAHGGADIQEINGYRTFAAPPLTDVAKRLLPQATYEKPIPSESTPRGTKTKAPSGGDERELRGLFGGAP
jgi:hypothetical protein